jgi:hypothetical protein
MVEYGGAIKDGPAGQVSGGTSPLGQTGGVDLGASIGRFINDATNTISTMSPIELLALAAVVFVGLIVLRRVF